MIDDRIWNRIAARLDIELASPRRDYRPLRVGDAIAGWLDDARVARIGRFADVFAVNTESVAFVPGLDDPPQRTRAMARVAAALDAEGALSAWRDELYAVAPEQGAPPWFLLERAAARYFGVRTWAVHVNGLVGQAPMQRMWLARRSPGKAIDPGMLDNFVGGGIEAGVGVTATLRKEAWEEAGIAPDLADQAEPAGTLAIRCDRPDGLQRETIFVHDLQLREDFVPANQDGEVVEHRLVSLPDAARLIALAEGPDVVTADASLVVLDCLLRIGSAGMDARTRVRLEALRHR